MGAREYHSWRLEPWWLFYIAYLVLTIALVMEAISLRQVVRQLRREAEVYNRDVAWSMHW